jgi:hypothetical protein
VSVTLVANPAGPNGASFTITVDPPTSARLTCVAGDDRWEAARGAASTITVEWTGLLADVIYDCVAEAGDGLAQATLQLPPLPADLPDITVQGDTEGYTLFNHARREVPPRLLLVDPQGRVRWIHDLPAETNVSVEASYLEATSQGPLFLVGGGAGMHPTLLGLDHEAVWVAPESRSGQVYHHDTVWLPETEDVLGLSWADNLYEGEVYQGFDLERFEAFGTATPWAWGSQQAVDRGQLPPVDEDYDAYHTNAVVWNPTDPDGASFFVNLKRIHQLVRLDVETGDVTARLGPGGDVTLLAPDGREATADRWPYGAHGVKAALRPDGTWDLWYHDNGLDRPGTAPAQSRVVHLRWDVDAATATTIWEWTEPGWFEPVFGDVDVLPSGHLLVTRGHCPQCGDARDSQRTSLLEIDPTTDEVVWRLTLGDELDSGYRADRIQPCDLFPEHVSVCR